MSNRWAADQSKEYRFEALQHWPCFSYTETTSKFLEVCEVVLVPKPKLSDLKQNELAVQWLNGSHYCITTRTTQIPPV